MPDPVPQVVLDDIGFGECPRWQDGVLWLLAMDDHLVCTVDEAGTLREVLCTTPRQMMLALPHSR